jgi:hypothetical protein
MAKEKNISIDDARALVADEALWPRMRDFLWDFTPQIHASWLEGLRIPDGTAHSQRIKTYVLSSLGVAPVFHSFSKGDWSRLLLLDGATLEAIAKWLGAIVFADDLRRVMDGAAVRALKASLSGVYPEVFGFTAYFSGIDLKRKDAETRGEGAPSAENVVSTGLSMIDALLAPLPEALVSRLKLKLPKDTSAPAPLRSKPEACGKALAKLLKLKFPEAYKLCC